MNQNIRAVLEQLVLHAQILRLTLDVGEISKETYSAKLDDAYETALDHIDFFVTSAHSDESSFMKEMEGIGTDYE